MLEMWTDFVKTANPTPKTNIWTKMSENDPKWLYFNANKSEMVSMNTEKVENWMKLYENYPPLIYYALNENCPSSNTVEGNVRNEF